MGVFYYGYKGTRTYYLLIGKKLNNVFDEKDVLPFFILLRSYASSGSPTLEIGNFIAHRERDRGHIHEYLQENRDIADQDGFVSLELNAPPVFTVGEIVVQ